MRLSSIKDLHVKRDERGIEQVNGLIWDIRAEMLSCSIDGNGQKELADAYKRTGCPESGTISRQG